MPVIEQNFIFPSDLDPDVFGEKTKGGKKYITVTVGAEGAGTDTNEVQFGTETKTVKNVVIDGEHADFIFTEVLNHNQQGKRMFVLTDVIQDDTSLVYPSNNGVSPSEPDAGIDLPQPSGDDFTGVARRTYIGSMGNDGRGIILTSLEREISNIPFDIKIITDRQDIDGNTSFMTIRKVDDGFIATVTDFPGSTNQELSFYINDFDPSMSLSLEFPDGKTAVYQPS